MRNSSGDGAGLKYPGGRDGDTSLVLVRVRKGVTRKRSSRAGISAKAARVRLGASGDTSITYTQLLLNVRII